MTLFFLAALHLLSLQAHVKHNSFAGKDYIMDSPFLSLFILILFVLFAYLYMRITNKRSHNHFPFGEKDIGTNVERHFAGYKQKSWRDASQ
jgi:hypothetical protein